MKKERIYYWDNLKALLIFLVVLGHFLLPVSNQGKSLLSVCWFVYLFHMPAFIFVSGYFAKVYMKKDTPDVSRLFGFLILFFVYKGLIWGVGCLLKGKIIEFELLTVNSAPWYLLAMFAWYIYLPVFAKLKAEAGIIIAVSLGLLIGFEPKAGAFLSIARCVVCSIFALLSGRILF